MPINPEMKHLYPSNWREISQRIRFGRAKGKCECCGARHHWYRAKNGMEVDPALIEEWFLPFDQFSRIVLTTAHLDQDPTNNDEANLAALCQRCHLRYDLKQHLLSRRVNRERATGQQRLFAR